MKSVLDKVLRDNNSRCTGPVVVLTPDG